MTLRTAVIVRVRLPGPLERLRSRHDPGAASGIPAHVTLLFPFLSSFELTASVRGALAGIATGVPPFDVRFERVERFPEAVWLAPEPATPFLDLTAAIVHAFPDHPPYDGRHDEVVPHLTIGQGEGAELDRLEAAARDCPPFEAHVGAIEVIAEAGAARWRRHWRIGLGRRVRP
jgi:2'-5' RNA ligase